MAAASFESLLEGMLQLSLDDSHGATAHPDAVAIADQLASAAPAQQPAASEHNRVDEWAEVLVRELATATSMEDAKNRAARILEAFGGRVCSRAAQLLVDKDRALGAVLQQRDVMKKAVVAQHRRHLEDQEKGKELERQVDGYREQVRRLEADNYALSVYLKNAGPGSSMPGNFHPPEVF